MIGDAHPATIGIISERNIESEWASTHSYIARSLRERGVTVEQVGSPTVSSRLFRWLRPRSRPFESSMYLRPDLLSALRNQSRLPDFYLNLHCSVVTPHVQLSRPFGYVTDATPELMHDYYDSHRNTTLGEFERLEQCERETAERAAAVFVPSQWAADSMIGTYGAQPERVHVVEWGANCESPVVSPRPHRPIEEIQVAPRLLFVGLDWDRKGGDLAIAAANRLAEDGRRPELHVVGAEVPRELRRGVVRIHGKLNRSVKREKLQLDELYRRCDIALHPARAECYGHVLCEAQAYGLPVITFNTGGVSQCVTDGETGRLLPVDSDGAAIADCIRDLLAEPDGYRLYRENAIKAFADRLNWNVWAERTLRILYHELAG